MKKQYILLLFIIVFLYLLYINSRYKWKEFKINSYLEETQQTNETTKQIIAEDKDMLEYISTKAYKNKVLKEEQSMRNKGEVVILITNQDKYDTYALKDPNDNNQEQNTNAIQNSMTVFEKWVFFLFGKDIR